MMKKETGPVRPGVKLYISGGGSQGMFGDGKWCLLKAIEEEGSISKAAEKLGRGYRKAWGDLKRTEAAMGRKLVRKKRGGRAGGTTELTESGRQLVEGWERYRQAVLKGMDGAFETYLSGILERSEDER
jgi:molybdate transport repressor ModE-like protein